MQRLVAIDWLGFAMRIAHSVNSPNIAWSFPKTPNYEPHEIALRIFSQLYLMREQRGWVGGIVAADHRGNYWRTKYLSDWYATHSLQAKGKDGTIYLSFNNGVYPIMQDGVFSGKALPGKSCPKDEDLIPICEGIDENGDPDAVYWGKVSEENLHLLPKYKGNRAKSTWQLATQPDTFYKMMENWRKWAAQLIGAASVGAESMEADDLCAWATTLATIDWNLDVVTGDSDYHQLVAVNQHIEILDIFKGRIRNENASEVLKSLGAKIISGDTSDNIAGMPKGARGCYGKDGAVKLMDSFTGTTHDELLNYLSSLGNAKEIQRNVDLIVLPNHSVREVCVNAIMSEKPTPPEKTWEFFGVNKDIQERLKSQAFATEFASLYTVGVEDLL